MLLSYIIMTVYKKPNIKHFFHPNIFDKESILQSLVYESFVLSTKYQWYQCSTYSLQWLLGCCCCSGSTSQRNISYIHHYLHILKETFFEYRNKIKINTKIQSNTSSKARYQSCLVHCFTSQKLRPYGTIQICLLLLLLLLLLQTNQQITAQM